ncbi:MAG: prepilin-type N-terminal cleavage/methylation domain-containing protein [bacterium]|nr:prepilin-type N-terminal cleavage/methylation domain-containing protein [bacterium]
MLSCHKQNLEKGFTPLENTTDLNRRSLKILSTIKSSLTGFTLIETMVAFFIFSMVFISLAYSFPRGLMINKTAENSTKASYLAQSQLEHLYSLGYGDIATGVIEVKHKLSLDPASYLYYFQRQTQAQYVDGNLGISAADLGLKKITVTVYYINSFSKTEKTYVTTTLINQW